LLDRAVRLAREAGCAPVVVVLGASADAVRAGCALGDALVVRNDSWTEGMGSSIRTGLDALGKVEGCVVMTCDMPAVTVAHLQALMGRSEVTASVYAGRHGVPAYFPALMFPALQRLRGEEGARELLQLSGGIELLNGALDIDRREDLERARKLWPALASE
jgi:molybdenum cofactor cytidylyltransferase